MFAIFNQWDFNQWGREAPFFRQRYGLRYNRRVSYKLPRITPLHCMVIPYEYCTALYGYYLLLLYKI